MLLAFAIIIDDPDQVVFGIFLCEPIGSRSGTVC
jgi:hypothetical protein